MNEIRKIIRKNIVPIVAALLALFGYGAFSQHVEDAEPYIEQVIEATTPEEALVEVPGMWRVDRISDGDTIVVYQGDDEEKVRLLGIDAPELPRNGDPAECYASEAGIALTALIDGQSVRLETDDRQSLRDRYGRLLAYVYTPDGTLVNQRLLEGGFVRELTVGSPYSKQTEFLASESMAKQQFKGLWNTKTCRPERV